MTNSHPAPSSIRDDSICESSLPPNKSSGDIVELKPCPFCHSEGHTLLRGFRYADECPDRKELAVMCPTCEARAPLKAWNTRTPDPESAAEIERLRRENETSEKFKVGLRELLGTPPDGSIVQSLMELATKLRTAESAVAAAWEEAAKIAENYDVVEIDDDPRGQFQIAAAIRAAVSKKTGEV